MKNSLRRFLWATALLFSIASFASGQVADVAQTFAEIPSEGTPFTLATDDVRVPEGGHWQGMQMRFDAENQRHLLFLSHDSATRAYLYVVEFPESLTESGRVLHVHEFPSDGKSPPLRHSGGIQLVGNVLVVGLEDNQQKTRSEVQFWDVSDPQQFQQLSHLTVRRRGKPKAQTAGAVGLVQRENDHLLAVANWDSRAIDFYVTDGKPLRDAGCRFTFQQRWRDETADKSHWKPNPLFGSHQAIQLLTDADDNLFLVGFHTASDQDLADLFAIDLQKPAEHCVCKRSSRPITLPGSNHFRYAAGLWFGGDRLRLLASERNLQPVTQFTITP